ncbi:hypothetical protein E8E13_000988 [Curvularia kusanoi]|uniref:Uncharacterized protein n=1 Tax=Curvularia kusanoi TaxID=90978 RepID=A0A9P4T454_CURKU|nr:hypothetical protein E8E13_000988 [Curvularia kusanoi]
MPTLKYGTEVLDPITMPLPKLQRSASVPELGYDVNSSQPSSCPYEVGKTIRLCLDNRVVKAEIIKLFTPFTMAPAMIIRIYAPHMDLTGDFVLKVYDRSCTVECREEHNVPDWDIERDMEFMKSRFNRSPLGYVYDLIHSDSHQEYSADEELGTQEVIDEDSSGVDGCELEEFKVEHGMLKMYSHELEFYRRAREHDIDGEDVPRFFSTVRIPHGMYLDFLLNRYIWVLRLFSSPLDQPGSKS